MTGSALLSDIIAILVGGFTGIGEGMGAGLSVFAESILFTTVEGTATMSAFATVLFIFMAISLSMSLFRWVLNFVTSMGQRNR